MNEFAFASIKTLRQALDSGKISVPELVSFYHKRFAQFDGQLGAALEVFDEKTILEQTQNQGPLLRHPWHYER